MCDGMVPYRPYCRHHSGRIYSYIFEYIRIAATIIGLSVNCELARRQFTFKKPRRGAVMGCGDIENIMTGLWADSNSEVSERHLMPVHTGDYSRRFRRQFVAENGDCCRIRQQSPVLATVAELGDYSRQCGQALRRREILCILCTRKSTNRVDLYRLRLQQFHFTSFQNGAGQFTPPRKLRPQHEPISNPLQSWTGIVEIF